MKTAFLRLLSFLKTYLWQTVSSLLSRMKTVYVSNRKLTSALKQLSLTQRKLICETELSTSISSPDYADGIVFDTEHEHFVITIYVGGKLNEK